jgi:hypothetical protein
VLPVLPLNVLESADFGQGMVMDNLMSSLPPAAGAVQMQSRFGSDWQAQVKTYLETNPYFEEVQGRYILCELLLMQPKASLFSSVGSVFVGQYCGGGKEDENTLDTKVQLPPWQPDAAACIQSDSPSTLSRLPFDSIQLQEEGVVFILLQFLHMQNFRS